MELWLWAFAAVVGFTLLSGLFSRYRRDGKESRPSTDDARSTDDTGSRNEGRPRPDRLPEDGYGHPRPAFFGATGDVTVSQTDTGAAVDGERRCRRCGAINEASPAFTYCRECVQRLT